MARGGASEHLTFLLEDQQVAKPKISRPKALRQISDAFETIVNAEADIEAASDAFSESGGQDRAALDSLVDAASAQLDAVETLRALAPTLIKAEIKEARVIAPVLAYADAKREKYSDTPLGDAMVAPVGAYERPSAAQRRELERRVLKGLGRLEEKVNQAEDNSRRGSERAAEREEVLFNNQLKEALAEVSLPPKGAKGRTAAAIAHLKANHQDLLNARAPDNPRSVWDRDKYGWFREIITASQRLRADRLRTAAALPITDGD
jgi:hypothetical protein